MHEHRAKQLEGQLARKEQEFEAMREAWALEKTEMAHEAEAFPVMEGELKRFAAENNRMKQEAHTWTQEKTALLADLKKEKERIYTKSMEATELMKEAEAMHVKGLEACEKAKELGKANDLMSMASQLNEMCDWNDSLRAEVGE